MLRLKNKKREYAYNKNIPWYASTICFTLILSQSTLYSLNKRISQNVCLRKYFLYIFTYFPILIKYFLNLLIIFSQSIQLFSHLYQHFPHRFPHTAQTLSAAAGKPDILQMQTRS